MAASLPPWHCFPIQHYFHTHGSEEIAHKELSTGEWYRGFCGTKHVGEGSIISLGKEESIHPFISLGTAPHSSHLFGTINIYPADSTARPLLRHISLFLSHYLPPTPNYPSQNATFMSMPCLTGYPSLYYCCRVDGTCVEAAGLTLSFVSRAIYMKLNIRTYNQKSWILMCYLNIGNVTDSPACNTRP